MYGYFYLDVLRVHTAIVRRITYLWLLLFGCIACPYSNRKENNICMACPFLLWLPLYGCIACSYSNRKENNICMASFIWMYCVFIQQS